MFEKLKGRKLYRSPKDALMFGVCAGLGHYLQVDPVFVRMVAMVLAVMTHVWYALAVYVALVVIVPVDPAQDTVPMRQEPKDVTPEASTDDGDDLQG